MGFLWNWIFLEYLFPFGITSTIVTILLIRTISHYSCSKKDFFDKKFGKLVVMLGVLIPFITHGFKHVKINFKIWTSHKYSDVIINFNGERWRRRNKKSLCQITFIVYFRISRRKYSVIELLFGSAHVECAQWKLFEFEQQRWQHEPKSREKMKLPNKEMDDWACFKYVNIWEILFFDMLYSIFCSWESNTIRSSKTTMVKANGNLTYENRMKNGGKVWRIEIVEPPNETNKCVWDMFAYKLNW